MKKNVTLHEICLEIDRTLGNISTDEEAGMVKEILNAERIFVAGVGRSGLMARGFSMRLMQMGVVSYFIGDVTTPAIERGDFLLIVSGSGQTASLAGMAKKALSLGAKIGLITIFSNSEIGKDSSRLIVIPALTPKFAYEGQPASVQPLGTLFEHCAMICMDHLICLLMDATGITEAEMFKRHANLE